MNGNSPDLGKSIGVAVYWMLGEADLMQFNLLGIDWGTCPGCVYTADTLQVKTLTTQNIEHLRFSFHLVFVLLKQI